MDAIHRWHAFTQSRDPAALHALLAEDAVFESPVVHTPQVGRDITMKYLMGALQVLGTDAFRYTNEWRNEGGAVLEFETEIDGVQVNGVDIIRLSDDAQRITHFKVMIRPLKAIEVVHRRMGELLARG